MFGRHTASLASCCRNEAPLIQPSSASCTRSNLPRTSLSSLTTCCPAHLSLLERFCCRRTPARTCTFASAFVCCLARCQVIRFVFCAIQLRRFTPHHHIATQHQATAKWLCSCIVDCTSNNNEARAKKKKRAPKVASRSISFIDFHQILDRLGDQF